MREQWSEAEYKAVRISYCYIYGPSTRNVRVEGLWRQQRYQATGPWLAYFNALQQADLYRQHQLADRVVFLFIFMPILREDSVLFCQNHVGMNRRSWQALTRIILVSYFHPGPAAAVKLKKQKETILRRNFLG